MKYKLKYLLLLVAAFWLLRPVSSDFINLPYSYKVDDSNNELLSATIASDDQWRFPISKNVPVKFEKCILTFEDERFYYHPGIDPLAVIRAIRQNIDAKKIVSGASTITMQLARLVLNHPNRSFLNKIKEVNLALRLELWHSKKEILSWYTSLAPFGGNVVGIEGACWKYFHKSPDQLSWAESATLAVLPNAPSLIHINKNRSNLKLKRDFLLNKLFQKEVISDMDLDGALSEPLPHKTFDLPNKAPHYLQFQKKSSEKNISNSIDPRIQESVADILNRNYVDLSQNEIYNASCVILDTGSGDVLAYHGNIPETKHESAVDLIQAPRSSGSILKPFLFAHMVNEGLITPSSFVLDIPTYIAGFSPSNYSRTYSGAVGADVALQRSLNIPAVRMLQDYGVDKFLHHLRKHGLNTLNRDADHYGLSLILGGGEVRLWELAKAYRNLGADLMHEKKSSSGLSLSSIYYSLEALKDLRRPDEEGNWQRMSSSIPIAWKTGTSYGHRDAWAIGVTPEITIATWVGNADGEGREGIIGTTTAGKLLFEILGILDLNGEWFKEPLEEVQYFNVCRETGFLANTHCEIVDTILWPNITERTKVCPYHEGVFTTLDNQYRINGTCRLNEAVKEQVYLNLPPHVAQFYKTTHPEFHSIPPLHPACIISKEYVMDITYPQENDDLFLPLDLNGHHQKLVAKVAHLQQNAQLFWYLDQNYLGTSEEPHILSMSPDPGKHKITVVDQSGNRVSRSFMVYNSSDP